MTLLRRVWRPILNHMEASDTGRGRWVALGALSVKSIARDR
jgi:hypothetical protein